MASWLADNSIEIIGILANAFLAIWIVNTVQNKITNDRYLKDHLIGEVKDIRSDYREFLSNLTKGEIKPKNVPPWFKVMNIKMEHLLEIISLKYNVDESILDPYRHELLKLITEFDEFEAHYKSNTPIKIRQESLSTLLIFQQKYNHLFNHLIIHINDE